MIHITAAGECSSGLRLWLRPASRSLIARFPRQNRGPAPANHGSADHGAGCNRLVGICAKWDMRPFLQRPWRRKVESSHRCAAGLSATSALISASGCRFATAKSKCGQCTSHRNNTHRGRRGRPRFPAQQRDPSIFSPPLSQIY